MCTSLVLIALTGFWTASATKPEPNWLSEYGTARQQGREEDKPIAVFIGAGEAGWNQVCRDGRLGADVNRLLAQNYVCLYVDTDTAGGRGFASELDIPEGPGLVISSPTGRLQAFRHEGDLA